MTTAAVPSCCCRFKRKVYAFENQGCSKGCCKLIKDIYVGALFFVKKNKKERLLQPMHIAQRGLSSIIDATATNDFLLIQGFQFRTSFSLSSFFAERPKFCLVEVSPIVLRKIAE